MLGMLRRFALPAIFLLAACSRETRGLTTLGRDEMRALVAESADAVIEKRDYRVAETLAFPEGARVTIEPGARWSGRVPGVDSNAIYRNLVDFESDPSAKIGNAR